MAQPIHLSEVETSGFPPFSQEGRNPSRPGAPTGGLPHGRLRALRLIGPADDRAEPRRRFGESVIELGRWIAHSLRVAMWANPATEASLQVDPAGLRALIRNGRVALVTTRDRHGHLHTRPMAPTRRRFDGELWFATAEADPIIGHVRARAPVQVTYLDGPSNRSLVLNGVARVCERTDNAATLPQWFTRRKEIPAVTYIRVDVMSADVWQ